LIIVKLVQWLGLCQQILHLSCVLVKQITFRIYLKLNNVLLFLAIINVKLVLIFAFNVTKTEFLKTNVPVNHFIMIILTKKTVFNATIHVKRVIHNCIAWPAALQATDNTFNLVNASVKQAMLINQSNYVN
jgi:hypothetical protein